MTIANHVLLSRILLVVSCKLDGYSLESYVSPACSVSKKIPTHFNLLSIHRVSGEKMSIRLDMQGVHVSYYISTDSFKIVRATHARYSDIYLI